MTGSPTLGPGSLLNSDGSLVLSSAQWAALQAYCYGASQLPPDMNAFKTYLPAEPSQGYDTYQPLVDCWQNINSHAATWVKDVFPASVNCAADIVHYADKVPVLYGALRSKLDILLDPISTDADKAAAKQALTSVVETLRTDAQARGDRATLVNQGMTAFAEDSKRDQAVLTPLHDQYLTLLADESPTIATLQKEYDTFKAAIDSWNAKWVHDTVVAATTPSYAWMWPFGTIAGAVVAGIYGKRATDDLSQAAGSAEKAKVLAGNLKSAHVVSLDLQRITTDLNTMFTQLGEAATVIEGMEGRWTALGADLKDMLTIIDNDLSKADDFIKTLGLDEAIGEWARIGAEADGYRQNAFVTITPSSPQGV